jgi:peptide/nickel transport system substrate-binding protein
MVPGNPKLFPTDKLVPFPATFDSIGPYQMMSFKENEQIVLAANPNYFGADKPLIPNVIIKYYSTPELMSQAVEKGEIDIAWRILGAVEATRLSSISSVVVTKINAPTLRYLVFNCEWAKGQ